MSLDELRERVVVPAPGELDQLVFGAWPAHHARSTPRGALWFRLGPLSPLKE
jgi:hypothetical protein